MIYHYYDPWHGVRIWNTPADTGPTWTTTNYPAKSTQRWTSTSALNTITKPKISVVKSDKFTTLVIRDENDNIVVVVDLTTEEATSLVESLVDDNDS